MRFKIVLTPLKDVFGNRLPLNYQYEQSAVVYRILHQSSAEFSGWLHDNGYVLKNGKSFKLFCYSRFAIQKYRLHKSVFEIEILSDTIEWYLTFLPEIATENFVRGVFSNQQIEIGNRQVHVRFQVQGIEVVPSPHFSEIMDYQTLSPICISLKQENGYDRYISPAHPEASRLILSNLLDKYLASTGEKFPINDFPFEMQPLTEPKSVLIAIKANTQEESKVRGFMCKFSLRAPVELQKILYESGCGGKNSQGFGMVKVELPNERSNPERITIP